MDEEPIVSQFNYRSRYDIQRCSCGAGPRVYPIVQSMLRLRVVACKDCRISGPARRSDVEAVEQWNLGHRINADGNRICECCQDDLK